MGLLALGSTLIAMGPPTFTLGTCVAYAGIAWLLFDWWHFSEELIPKLRLLGTISTITIALIITWVVFRPAPLTISLLPINENYAEGTDLAGIKWSSKYSGFRVVLRNDADFQYTNIEFLIRTDVMIAAVGFNAKFSQCAAKPTLIGADISGVSIGVPDKDGSTKAIPLDLSLANVYKIFCDKILAHDPLEIVVATRRNLVTGGFDAASAVAIRGAFEGFLRSRPLAKSECLIQGCTPVMLP